MSCAGSGRGRGGGYDFEHTTHIGQAGVQSGERADIRAVAQAVGRERAARHAGGVVHDVKHAILWAIRGRGAIVRRPKERTWVTPGAVREITFKTCKATYMSYFSFERSSSTIIV